MKNCKTKIDILIVDDEIAGRGILKKLLPELIHFPIDLYEANSVANAHKVLKQQNIDLVFLDIQMPEENGFELLKQLPYINFETIFITGFDKYAVTAFKFNAIDYLLKPVDIEELKLALQKAIIRINEKQNSQENIVSLLASLPEKGGSKRIAIHQNNKVVFINASIISHIIAIDNYSQIITFNKEKYTSAHLLKEFESYFENTKSFVRISRSVIINLQYIQSYSKDYPFVITLKSGEEFEISRRKKGEILSLLDTF